jgi:hypothetical protein
MLYNLFLQLNKLNYLLLIITLVISSCAPNIYLQDGRTLGSGKKSQQISINTSNLTKFNTTLEGILDSNEQASVFDYTEVTYIEEFAINNIFDVGYEINSVLNTTGKFKFQILGNKTSFFAASLGGKLSTHFIFVIMGLIPINIQTPLYLSIHPSKNISIYTVHSFLYNTSFFYDSPEDENIDPAFINSFGSMGNTLGILFNSKFQIGIELTSLNNIAPPYIISLGGKRIF